MERTWDGCSTGSVVSQVDVGGGWLSTKYYPDNIRCLGD